MIRSSLADALDEGGYLLIESENAADAVKEIDDHPHLAGIITDIRLGLGSNGWEVARHARSKNPHLAVVYMSGDSGVDWAAEGVPNSVMVQKPFASAQVVIAVSTLLNAADISPVQPSPD